MAYDLYIGDFTYSSWSLRAWLLFEKFGLPVRLRHVDFHDREVADQLTHVFPARTVPALVDSSGCVTWDSLAIAEELADRHPEAGLWPSDPARRAMARALACEMHSGFAALRRECPMNLRSSYSDVRLGADTLADIDRIDDLWTHARARFGEDGPWLAGHYSVADAFYAPVAARFASYRPRLSAVAQAYVEAHLSDPAFRRWRAMGLARGQTLPWYDRPFARAPWPGPASSAAQAIETGQPVNETCPYSGLPARYLLRFEDRVFGFCNRFCRDKTLADPEAWPAFMALARPD